MTSFFVLLFACLQNSMPVLCKNFLQILLPPPPCLLPVWSLFLPSGLCLPIVLSRPRFALWSFLSCFPPFMPYFGRLTVRLHVPYLLYILLSSHRCSAFSLPLYLLFCPQQPAPLAIGSVWDFSISYLYLFYLYFRCLPRPPPRGSELIRPLYFVW